MRATPATRCGPVARAPRRPPGRARSHRRWTDRRGLDSTSITPPSGGTTTTLGYNQADQLISENKGSAAVTYINNGDGLRTTASGSTAATYTWDITASVPNMLDDGTTAYLYGPAGPFEQVTDTGDTATYLSGDHQQSTRLLTSATGAQTGTYSYSTYGNTTSHSGTGIALLEYNGQYADPTTGLLYLRARDYDPTTGQFLSADPDEMTTGTPFAYVGNDPVDGSDPAGLCNKNPLSGSFWTSGNCLSEDTPSWVPVAGQVKSFAACAGAGGTSVHDCAVMNLDPAYLAIEGYSNEWQDSENGCPLSTIIGDGAEAVSGVAGTAGIAVGLAGPLAEPLTSGDDTGGGSFGKGGGANDAPSWVTREGGSPLPGESAQQYASRILNDKYGPGNWPKGAGSEFSKIVKWVTRGGRLK